MKHTDIQLLKIKESLRLIINSNDHQLKSILPSQWAEKHRMLTTDVSPFPGPMNYERTPYLIEPLNCLSPDHPARVVAVMKGAQIGFSTGVIESGIGWIIAQNPGNILFLTGDKKLSSEAIESKIDQMLDSCGLRSLIGPQSMRKRNMRTGDTSSSKEFPGGRLIADGLQNLAGKMRQRSMRYGFIDDFEAAPKNDAKGGSTTSLIETRFKAYYDIMKLYYISTPELKASSNIEPVYLLGDQRHYYVPCPRCGKKIDLLWSIDIGDGNKAGIYYEVDDNGKYIEGTTGYICQKCGGFFKDKHKYEMNLSGEWRPTEEPSEPGYYSYLINSLYAPPGMTNWEGYVRDWVRCNPMGSAPKIRELQTFINTVLAQTFEDRGTDLKATELSKQVRGYEIGVIPEDLSLKDGNGNIILVTCAADLGGTTDDARLDYEIVAWTESGSSYSIDHGSIGSFKNRRKNEPDEGRDIKTYRNDQSNNVWTELKEILEKEYIFDNGKRMKIMISGVDTGHFTHYAYNFIDTCGLLVFGIKGRDELKARRIDADTPYYTLSKERRNLYLLYVNLLKDELAEKMKLKWLNELEPQPAGFMNFPSPSNGKYNMKSYFSHFEAEHRAAETNRDGEVTGMIWKKKNSTVQNHFFDCRVYNEAVKDILVGLICAESKIRYPNWQDYVRIITGK